MLLLGKAGRTVFLGPAAATLPYFTSIGFELPANENPADFCLDIISGVVACRGNPGFRPEVEHLKLLNPGFQMLCSGAKYKGIYAKAECCSIGGLYYQAAEVLGEVMARFIPLSPWSSAI